MRQLSAQDAVEQHAHGTPQVVPNAVLKGTCASKQVVPNAPLSRYYCAICHSEQTQIKQTQCQGGMQDSKLARHTTDSRLSPCQ